MKDRKTRGDIQHGTLEARLGVSGVFRNADGRKTRKDKRLDTARRQAAGRR